MVTLFVIVLLLLLRIETLANKFSEPYSCYGDVCNSDSTAQFCDIVYRYCRRCDEIRRDCFTRHQTFNCTEYCYEIRYKEDVEKLRVAGCQVPHPPEHGLFEGTHTHVPINDTLNVTCDEGYESKNEEPIRCGEFSVWIGPQPTCESSTKSTPIVVICLGALVAMSLVLNIVLLTRMYWCRVFSKTNEKQTEDEEDKPLMIKQRNDSHAEKQSDGSVHHGYGRPFGPTAPPEEQSAINMNEPSVLGAQAEIHDGNKSINRQSNPSPEHIASSEDGINESPAEGATKHNAEGNPQPDEATVGITVTNQPHSTEGVPLTPNTKSQEHDSPPRAYDKHPVQATGDDDGVETFQQSNTVIGKPAEDN